MFEGGARLSQGRERIAKIIHHQGSVSEVAVFIRTE